MAVVLRRILSQVRGLRRHGLILVTLSGLVLLMEVGVASNRKTADERTLAPAEADLRWYFGNGASTAAGDMGLRSSLGSQLEAMHAGIFANPVVNVDAIEMRMARGVDAVGKARLIAHALGATTPTYQAVLHHAYGGKEMRPGVTHVVRMTAEARKATALIVGRQPNEGEIEQSILAAESSVPWLTKAKAAAEMLTAAALQAYADERAMLGPAAHSRMQWEFR